MDLFNFDADSFPIFLHHTTISPTPFIDVGKQHVKDKVKFIFSLLANRTTGNNNNTDKRIYAVQRLLLMMIGSLDQQIF
jgi:hypothetical protein